MIATLKVIFYATASASLLLFVAGPALARFKVVPPNAGLGLFTLGMLLGVAVTIVGIVIAIRGGPKPLLWTAYMGVIPAAFLAYSIITAFKFPLINDITTNPADPPEFVHAATLPENAGRDMSFPPGNKALIEEGYPDLAPLVIQAATDDVLGRAMDIARQRENWTITDTHGTGDEIAFEGYAVTPMFRFVDDFVVRVKDTGAGNVVVDMRSKSRDGQGDLGANAARIREFLAELQ